MTSQTEESLGNLDYLLFASYWIFIDLDEQFV